MKHKKILFVCTGNTCRSPMAEAVLKAELKRRKISWYSVQSAGLNAQEGSPISGGAAMAMKEAKIPFSAKFKSRKLTDKMIEDAYAVVFMTERQKAAFMRYPNVTSFYELCGREIPDPFGGDADLYRATLRIIRASMDSIIRGLKIRAQEV